MGLSSTGLTVETYEEVLDDIITSEQENVSSQIEVGDDTSLGETNKIMASQISSVNQVLQDIYDQRDIYEAEGTALDDNISWLGLTRQSATATSGEQYFLGTDGTTISSGSYLKNENTQKTFTTDAAVTINKNVCKGGTVEVLTVASTGSSYQYEVTVNGIQSTYTYADGDTDVEIIYGLAAALTADTDGTYTGTVNSDDNTLLDIRAVDDNSLSVSADDDDYLDLNSIIATGNITGTITGAYSATKNSVTTILSPTSGWNSTYNPSSLVIGRDEETDAELRDRAINYRSSAGKATVDSIKAALLNVDGVSSVTINEQFVSDGAGDSFITIISSTDDTYPITINGTQYSYTSSSETNVEIASGLALVIDPNADGYSGNGLRAVDNGDGTITVASSTLYRISSEVDSDDSGLLSVVEGQPSGSMQVVIAGGSDFDDIAQEMWDTKPGGVEFWAVSGDTHEEGTADDDYGDEHEMVFNRPDQVDFKVTVTYTIFDNSIYPDDEEDAKQSVRDAIADFGNDLEAGDTITPGEFEGSVYGAVNGIYDVYIEMEGNGQEAASDDRDGEDTTEISLSSDQQAYFQNNETWVVVTAY